MGYSRGSILLMILFSLGAVLFTHGIFHQDQSFDGIPILIVDEDESEFSIQLIELLVEEEYLQVSEGSIDHGMEKLRRNRVEGVYRIHKGFEEEILKDEIPRITAYISPKALGAGAIGEVITSRAIRLISSTRAANLVLREGAQHSESSQEREALWQRVFDRSEEYWEPEPLMTLSIKEVHLSGDEINPTGQKSMQVGFLTGPEGILISFLSFFSAWVFYHRKKEWDSGVLRRQLLILGKKKLFMTRVYRDYIVIYVQSIVLFGFYGLLSGTLGFKNLLPVLIVLAGISLLWLGIWNVLVGVKMNEQWAWSGIPVGLLISSIAGGGIWSMEVFPEGLRKVGGLTPQGFFLEANRMIRLNNYSGFILLMMMIFILGLCLLSLGFHRYKKITLPR